MVPKTVVDNCARSQVGALLCPWVVLRGAGQVGFSKQ